VEFVNSKFRCVELFRMIEFVFKSNLELLELLEMSRVRNNNDSSDNRCM